MWKKMGEIFLRGMTPCLLPLREKVDRRVSAETDEGHVGARLSHPTSPSLRCGSATFSLKGRMKEAPFPRRNAAAAWQILVIVAQPGIGTGLVLGGLRRRCGFAFHNKDHAERLAQRTGQSAGRSLRPAMHGLVKAVGVVLMATIDMTAEALRPPQSYWERPAFGWAA